MQKMKKLLTAALVFLLFTAGAGAQNLEHVQRLYEAGMYSEALRLIGPSNTPSANGFKALCALEMRSPGARRQALAFLERYPENFLVPQVRFRLGLDCFDAGLYQDALDQLNRIGLHDLPDSQKAEYTYKLGYSAFGIGDWDRAATILRRLQDLPYSEFTAPACYTQGYICYAQKDFREAARWFGEAAKDARFMSIANYYILECRFNEKDYAYVVRFGENLFDKVPAERRPHLARIMSESYLILGDVEKAQHYYEKILAGKTTLTRSDYFYAGEINYLTKNWQGAVDNFTRMGALRDSLGQTASYQLGYSYIQLKNKVAAMDAFKNAAELDYSSEIREDARYNYAKLAFDLNRDTAPFHSYLDDYGSREKGTRIYSYMAMVALQDHDYEAAVAAYDNIDELDPSMQDNYMKACFLRARELMESGSWRNATPLLKAAAYYSPRKAGFNQLARYYQAEALYRDGQYSASRDILTDLYNLSALPSRPEGALIPYQIGYAYFKEGDYDRALKWFRTYLDGDARFQGSDAEVRIADCYFFKGQYADAVAAYERQMTDYPEPDNLYPLFRAGVASGLLDDNRRKVHFLEGVESASPEAPYYGESLYELGRAYVALHKTEDATRTFRTLQATTTDPSLTAQALLELGMIERNAGHSNQALDCYKQVVAQGGSYAEDALLAIESIYRTREDPEAYLAYVNSLGSAADRSEAQKEEVYFSSAEQMYLSGDYPKAQATLLAYLEKYPQAAYGAKARFYLADCYRNASNKEQAADLYLQALDEGLDDALAESALLHEAALQYEMENNAKAFGCYLRLLETARLDANRQTAREGMMLAAYKAREWEDALENASQVLDGAVGNPALEREARYIRAKSLLGSSRRDEALQEFAVLARDPSMAEGAEATYLLIQDCYDRADFDGIQQQVYDFSAKAHGQNYWLAKAFIVLGDTFAEQGNTAQAQATFESIRSGYTATGPQDDVPDQVELRLRKLETHE